MASSSKNRALYLVKANNDLVSWCSCDNAPVAYPFQADCPWCGCGWLFTCMKCHKAFTFARAVLMEETLEELAARDVQRLQKMISATGETAEMPGIVTAQAWIDAMQPLIGDVELGKTYVYFDGHAVPADAEGLHMRGMRRSHDLAYIPQVTALSNPAAKEILVDMAYWTAEDEG